MGIRIKRTLPVFMLTAAVPLIPVLALFIVPHPPSPACARPGCHSLALGAQFLSSSGFPVRPHQQAQLCPAPCPGARIPRYPPRLKKEPDDRNCVCR